MTGVVLVTAALFLAHATSIRNLRAQLVESNAAIVRELAAQISNRIAQLDYRIIELSGKRATLDFMHARFRSREEQLDVTRQVQAELNLIRRSDRVVFLAGIYSERSDYLLSDQIGLPPASLEGSRHVDVPVARSLLEALLGGESDSQVVMVDTEQGPVRLIPITRFYPAAGVDGSALGSIFLGLDTRVLSEVVLSGSNERVHELLVVDSSAADASVIASSSSWAENNLGEYTAGQDERGERSERMETRIAGRRFGIARVPIPETSWVMVGAIEVGAGTSVIIPMQITFLVLGVSMVVMALLSMIALSSLTIDPLISFVHKMSSWIPNSTTKADQSAHFPASAAHLSDLELRFREIVDQTQTLRDRFASATPILRRYCLRNLLTGTDYADDLISQLNTYGLQLHRGAFVVLRLALREDQPRSPRVVSSQNLGVSISESRLAELSSGYLQNGGRCAVLIETNNRLSVLISSVDRSTLQGAVLMTLAEQIRIGLATALGLSVSGGLGTVVSEANEITASWRAATRALEYTLLLENRALYRHEDVERVESLVPMRRILAEVGKVGDSVRAGNVDDARRSVSKLFRDTQSALLPVDSVRQIGIHVLMEGLRVSQESGCLIPEKHVREATAVWTDFDHAETTAEIEDLTTRVIHQLTVDVVSQRSEKHRHELVEGVIGYLEDHYQDSGTSLSSVSAQFGISPAYLSKIFKEYTGTKYIDFITALRVTVAKGLLERGVRNVNEVAELVGYANTRSFIRMFRAETGHTPGEYRRLRLIRQATPHSEPHA